MLLVIAVNDNTNVSRMLSDMTFYMYISAMSRVSFYGFENDTIKLYDRDKTVREGEGLRLNHLNIPAPYVADNNVYQQMRKIRQSKAMRVGTHIIYIYRSILYFVILSLPRCVENRFFFFYAFLRARRQKSFV